MTKNISSGIRAKQRFYATACNWGLDLKDFDPHSINFEGTKPKSSFKKRSQFVKANFNYRFGEKREILEKFPDISTIEFVRK